MSTDKAVMLYEDFTGQEADEIAEVQFKLPKVAIMVGKLEAVVYTTTRDGETEKYIHEFENNAPILAVSDDGRQLLIIGGNYEFTDHGIEG